MVKFAFPGTEQISLDEETKRLFLCREILEYGILLSVKVQDIPSFERYFAQIKIYYCDYGKRYSLPPSARQYMILGLNLLLLLGKNKLAEFHTELELIPIELHHQNLFVKHPVNLEQWMMEGSYNKVIKARSDVPSETYSFFMNILMDTVRNEIAGCMEKAFEFLSLINAQKLLGFSDMSGLIKYSEFRKWNLVTLDGVQQFYFKKQEQDSSKTEIPSALLIKRTLHYAKELEKIV